MTAKRITDKDLATWGDHLARELAAAGHPARVVVGQLTGLRYTLLLEPAGAPGSRFVDLGATRREAFDRLETVRTIVRAVTPV
jgi:hypothetical protein